MYRAAVADELSKVIRYSKSGYDELRVPNKTNRGTENWRFHFLQGRRSRQCIALSMEPDAVRYEISRLNAE